MRGNLRRRWTPCAPGRTVALSARTKARDRTDAWSGHDQDAVPVWSQLWGSWKDGLTSERAAAPKSRSAGAARLAPRAMVIRLAMGGFVVALVAPAVAGATPSISGADGDVWNAASPTPTYTITADGRPRMEWRLDGGRWVRERSAVAVLSLRPISDGQHVLTVREDRSGNGGGGDDDDGEDEATRRFRVHTAPPRIEILEPRAAAVYVQGRAVAARYSCSGAATCAGPVRAGQPLPTAAAGPASFEVRAVDDAGNPATARVDYAVAPPAPLVSPRFVQVAPLAAGPPPPPPPPAMVPPAPRRAHLLSPPAGEGGDAAAAAAVAPEREGQPLQRAALPARGGHGPEGALRLPRRAAHARAAGEALVRASVRVARLAIRRRQIPAPADRAELLRRHRPGSAGSSSGLIPRSATSDRKRRSISSLMGRTSSRPLPAGSSSSASRRSAAVDPRPGAPGVVRRRRGRPRRRCPGTSGHVPASATTVWSTGHAGAGH